MKILSWNINSVRLRAPIVLKMAEEAQPDIICLQETKCPNEAFPFKTFRNAGYEHIHIAGMKSYNGQAILSKKPFKNADIYDRVGKSDCRHISVTIDGIEIHNLYVPAGGDEPDTTINEKYKHKLDFVDEMSEWFTSQRNKHDKIVALGDFNIAPYEYDVWSSKQLENVVSHTKPEREKIEKMLQSLNFIDTARYFVPKHEKTYSWWSYRNKDWRKSNRGRRLDHIWITQPLLQQLKSYHMFDYARDWDKPSDHAPIMINLV